LRILDVGGTQSFWEVAGISQMEGVQILLLNIERIEVSHPNMTYLAGNATDLQQFGDDEFDVVFSNSVIEHVGAFTEQQKMADEIQRVGKTYYVQTPNRYFPVEPHFLFPFFQFLPVKVRTLLLQHFSLGWVKKKPDPDEARSSVESIRLLTRHEVLALFPQGDMHDEKVLGLTKSFVVVGR